MQLEKETHLEQFLPSLVSFSSGSGSVGLSVTASHWGHTSEVCHFIYLFLPASLASFIPYSLQRHRLFHFGHSCIYGLQHGDPHGGRLNYS